MHLAREMLRSPDMNTADLSAVGDTSDSGVSSDSDAIVDPAPPHDVSPLIIPSNTLFQGRQEIWIEHEQMMYRLRRTGSGKLYLSK